MKKFIDAFWPKREEMKNYFSGRSPIKVFSNYFCFMYYDECVKGNTKELFMVPNLMKCYNMHFFVRQSNLKVLLET